MKKIELKEQHKILLDLLNYVTLICEKNNIKYSLIGGSLIGAIRHKGFIPWDDDIDIILMPEEYSKLVNVLEKENNNHYLLLDPKKDDKYLYPFLKIVDTRTILIEKNQKTIDNYGVYIDIFAYHYVSNNRISRYIHYKLIVLVKKLLSASILDNGEKHKEKNILKIIRNIISNLLGNKLLKRIFIKLCERNNKSKYVLSNWATYGYKKEIQYSCDFRHYKKVIFENTYAYITEKFDNVLKTTFGDYMELPPKEKRISNHNTIIYWKENNEKN